MKKLTIVFATAACLAISCLGFAQSSGNFSYGTSPQNETGCVLQSNGGISGGEQCEMNCTLNADGTSTCTAASGTCIGNAVAGIKTSSGSGNVFVIRPSAVVGLLTDVTVSSKQLTASSSALAGVNVEVTVTPQSGQPAPTVIPSFPITYDARYIQISTNLFQALSTQCLAIDGGCFITFNESTVSAHSFDWIATGLSSGNYGVTVNWSSTLGGTGISQSLTCVGPLNLTVQQNKIFSFNSVNSF